MIYVTSDLHGCKPGIFKGLLQKAGFTSDDYLFILGDVIDRGQHGAELLLWLSQQPNMELLLGNHEAMLLSCRFLFDQLTEESLQELDLDRLRLVENWMQNGAAPTLAGLRRLLKQDEELLQGVLDYVQDAPLYETLTVNGRRFILVHAGLEGFEPDKPLDAYDPMALLWARPTPETRYFPDVTVILGHTPTKFFGTERAFHTDSWICIDTGAALGMAPMLLRLDDMAEFYADECC